MKFQVMQDINMELANQVQIPAVLICNYFALNIIGKGMNLSLSFSNYKVVFTLDRQPV